MKAPPLSLDTLAEQIQRWQNLRFGKEQKPHGASRHLVKEANEVALHFWKHDPKGVEHQPRTDWKYRLDEVAEELADVFFLLVRVADLTETNLPQAIQAKLVKNQNRTWKAPDQYGVSEHEK